MKSERQRLHLLKLQSPIYREKQSKKISGANNPSKRPEVRKKLSELRGHRNFREGTKHSEETKKRMSEIKKGIVFSSQTIEKMRVSASRRLALQKKKDTGIELIMEQLLKDTGLKYEKQVFLGNCAVVDFYLPDYKIIIQCDGTYWHNYPLGTDRDKRQDAILKEKGYKVYRFWEHEINKSAQLCMQTIKLTN